ncbi:MAG: flavin reductase family protein [Natronospirillum sp.]
MFYDQSDGHGLPYDPFKAILSPRPIGWISTIDEKGTPNLAPYSFFGAISSRPHMVMFSSEGLKDSPRNAQITGEFVFNLATLPLLNAMNSSSAKVAPEINEFDHAHLEMAPCRLISAPRVAASPAALECKVISCE